MLVFVWFGYKEASSGTAPSFGWKKETRAADVGSLVPAYGNNGLTKGYWRLLEPHQHSV